MRTRTGGDISTGMATGSPAGDEKKKTRPCLGRTSAGATARHRTTERADLVAENRSGSGTLGSYRCRTIWILDPRAGPDGGGDWRPRGLDARLGARPLMDTSRGRMFYFTVTVDGSVVGSGVAEIVCVLSVDRGPSDHLMGHAF
jgi:hypothetical protein